MRTSQNGGDADEIVRHIRPLNLGAEILESSEASELEEIAAPSSAEEARTLRIVLGINGDVRW